MFFFPTEKQKNALLKGIEVMCRIFWGPSPESCISILEKDSFSPFDDLGSELNCHPPNALRTIKAMTRSYSDADQYYNDLEKIYIRMFISDKNGIAAPLYESCYEFENAPLMGPPAIHMRNRFENKGLHLKEHLNEPPDHLCIELEYLYFLLQNGWNGNNPDDIKEAVIFASEIMLPWVDALRNKITDQDPDSFYPLSASLLCALLNLIGRINTNGDIPE